MTEIEQGRTVLVRLSGAAAMAARVERVDAEFVDLILLTPPLRPPFDGQGADVELTSNSGVVTIATHVTEHDGRGSVRVRRDSAGEAPRTVQRRDFVRVDATVPVVVQDGGPGGPAHEVLSLNVSGGGLLLTGLSHLQLGDFAWISLDLEDGSLQVEALVEVTREGDRGARGVQMVSISSRDEQRIVRFAFARERRARLVRDG